MSKWGKISYLVCGLSVIILFTARLILQGWVDYMYAPLFMALASFVAALIVDYKFYLEFLSMRTTKHGMNMGVLILMAMVFVVAVNFLGLRFDKTFDLTKEKINSLSEQSIDAVKNLKADLRVLIFYKGKQFKEPAVDIKNDFRLYLAASPKISVTVHDANFNVELAKKYLQNNEAFATIVEYKDKRLVVPSSGGSPERPVYQESDITSTIVKATRETTLTAYFLTGHGEKDIDMSSFDGIKAFAEALRRDGYTVAKLNLMTGDKMPEPPAVLAIVGPKTAFTDKELSDVREFAQKGGHLFLAIDPGEKHQLANLTKSWGIEFKNNYIVNEVAGTDDGITGAVGFEFDATNPVTKKIANMRSVVVFPFASELQKAPDADGAYVYNDIIKSHPAAYHVNLPNETVKDPERRSHVMAMTVKKDKFEAVVFGDSDFLSDVRVGSFLHGDLAMNAMAYLFDDEANITIRPKNFEATKLEITANRGLMIIVAGVSLPLLLIIMSGLFWYRRRNL